MIQQKILQKAALPLAALALALGACAPWNDPSPSPGGTQPGSSAGQDQRSNPPQGSESPPQDSGGQPEDSQTPSQGSASQPQDSASQPQDSEAPAQDSQSPAQGEEPTPPSQSVSPSPAQTSSQPPAAFTPPGALAESASVDDSWFSDAVFLGDSRTDGLRLYSGIKGASFISHQGLSVFTVGSNACINGDEGKITAMEALAKQQWAKVYLMLGVNELGYGTASFKSTYTKVVQEIKELQPEADIYLQTLIPINEPLAYKNGTSSAINNEKLKEFNTAIVEIAQAEGVYLVDVDSNFWSEEGCLAEENTGDGVHLTRAGYVSWLDYLKTHTAGSGSAGVTDVTFSPPPAGTSGQTAPSVPTQTGDPGQTGNVKGKIGAAQ